MSTNRELLAGFADPSIAFARELGRIAKSRMIAHGGEIQPVPEMFADGSAELREWRREYGHEGRESTWPRNDTTVAESARLGHSESPISENESFALAATGSSQKTKRPINGTSNRSTKTKSQSSTAASPEPAAQDEINRLIKIGVTQQEAHELVVGMNWNCESLVCAVEMKTTDGIPPRVVGLLRENWRVL